MTASGAASPMPADESSGVATLRVDGREVADYVWRPDLPHSSSPRPYLHPVRTLAGETVTAAAPDSHPHQLGISIAVPDVDGWNFWGGRTWMAGHGPAWLDNHGTQRHHRWLRQTSTELIHTLHWSDQHRRTLLEERRAIACQGLGPTAWSLALRTELTNATDRPLAFRSPAALGRTGAGFGGFFWRASRRRRHRPDPQPGRYRRPGRARRHGRLGRASSATAARAPGRCCSCRPTKPRHRIGGSSAPPATIWASARR